MEIQLWKEILSPYEQAVDELLLKFKHIIKDYRSQGLYSPIENVTGRVKRISSILDKMQKKHIPMDHIVEEMDDIAGIRIMCQFEEDIYKVVEIIRNRRDMSIREEKDYITNAKTSGYRSYHIILNYDVYTIKGLQTIQAEIQNLYYVGNQREVVKIQNEFYDIYQKDDLEKLEDFSKQLDIIAEGYKAQGL